MDYEDTKLDKKGNSFCLLFAGILLYVLITFIVKYIFGESESVELLWVIVFLVPFLAIFVGIPYVNIRNSKRNRNIAKTIKENGIKIKGTIKKIETTNKDDYKKTLFKRASFFRRKKLSLPGGTGGYREYYDYAVVEFIYKNETKIVNTPYLDFGEKDLISKDVDVFIYEDKVYVDNFKIKREEIKTRKRNWYNMQIKVLISFIIMIILVAISIYLTITGYIPKRYITYIIGGLIFIYFISASLIYLTYLDDLFNKEDYSDTIKFDEEEH